MFEDIDNAQPDEWMEEVVFFRAVADAVDAMESFGHETFIKYLIDECPPQKKQAIVDMFSKAA